MLCPKCNAPLLKVRTDNEGLGETTLVVYESTDHPDADYYWDGDISMYQCTENSDHIVYMDDEEDNQHKGLRPLTRKE